MYSTVHIHNLKTKPLECRQILKLGDFGDLVEGKIKLQKTRAPDCPGILVVKETV